MIQVALKNDVLLSDDSAGSVVVQRGPWRMRLTGLEPPAAKLLLDLAREPLSWKGLAPTAVLTRLAEQCLVRFTCVVDGRELLTADPHSSLASADFGATAPASQIRMSRFPYVRRVAEELVIESPLRFTRVIVREPQVTSLLAELVSACSVADLYGCCGLSPAEVDECVQFLLGVGVLAGIDPDGNLDEDTIPTLAQREFHDVSLHARSRWGLTDEPLGGSFPFAGVMPPIAAIKAPMSAVRIDLPKPDLSRLTEKDMPLAEVMERRRSIRRFGESPITLDQLGEFLYRVARVRSVRPPPAGDPRAYETSDRTYPSGGAAYDLEFYLTVGRCAGLAPGIYHYQPVEHALSLVNDRPKAVSGVIAHARLSAGWRDTPQTVITLASRFSRLGWKYRGICYALTLKNVGVLYEAMYLAATAMRLAPCALGGGDSAIFSRITGLDPLIESSVGEFILGSRPLPPAPPSAPGETSADLSTN